MTSDGITKKDWSLIHKQAVNIANASSIGDMKLSNSYEKQLHGYLRTLQKKYGPLPSIISTRADYTDDLAERVKLYKRAYRLAGKINDELNLMLAAWSLASIYIDDFKQKSNGREWLSRLKDALISCPDKYVKKEQGVLIRTLQRLDRKTSRRRMKKSTIAKRKRVAPKDRLS